jgi:hypothetical protein
MESCLPCLDPYGALPGSPIPFLRIACRRVQPVAGEVGVGVDVGVEMGVEMGGRWTVESGGTGTGRADLSCPSRETLFTPSGRSILLHLGWARTSDRRHMDAMRLHT